MHYAEHLPAPELRDVVRCYWFLRAGPPSDVQPAEPAFPDGSPELIFSLADSFIACPVGEPERRQPDAFLVGQISKPFAVRPSGRADLVAVRLEAHAATWLGLELASIVDRDVDVSACCEGALTELRAALLQTANVEDAVWETSSTVNPALEAHRVSLLNSALAQLTRRDPQPDWRVRDAVLAIRRQRGLSDLAALADELKTTPRSLQRLFHRDVGITPKFFARIVRFQQVFGAWREDPSSLSRVAQECGYFDHAHLVRDFRELAGVAPAALLPNMPEFTRLMTQG
jgi:AraC-like DNA-binding protein